MRHELDYYPTPRWVADAGIAAAAAEWQVRGRSLTILEPCAGAGHLSEPLREQPWVDRVITGDLIQREGAPLLDHTWDFLAQAALHGIEPVSAIFTNPPYAGASSWVRVALGLTPNVAMLLPLTWADPAAERADILTQTPPSHIVILPRPSFTGDGKTDPRTVAWFIWGTEQTPTTVSWVHPSVRNEARAAAAGQTSLF